MMSLWFRYSPNTASIHQELEIPCQGRKGGRFSHGVKGFQIKFLELNILYGGVDHSPDKHLWSTHSVPETAQGTGERQGLQAHSLMGETDKQEMIPEHALGAVETPRRGGSSHSGRKRQVKLSGGSRTACSSNHLRLGCISQAFKEKK